MPEHAADTALLALVIGVSGHRDLVAEDEIRLETEVRSIFRTLRHRRPNTPLWLLSPLAEGADRLVARVGLACGARLIVPLPMPQELYECDFATTESRDEFRNLLTAAAFSFTLPLAAGNSSNAELAHDGKSRNRQYAQVGAFVAMHCQYLIALWNGQGNGEQGGTWQVVEFMLDGVPEPFAPPTSGLFDNESGPVYHVPVRRESDREPTESTKATLLLPGHSEDRVQHERLQNRMRIAVDRYNRDVREVAPRLRDKQEGSRRWLFSTDDTAVESAGLETLQRRFGIVDALAIHYQRKTLRTLKILLLLSFAAILLLQSCLAKVAPAVLLPLYALIVVASVAYYHWTKNARHETKYLDYRALSEGLRVQVYWRMAGLTDCVADHYMRRQRGVLEWVRNALRNWTLDDRPVVMHTSPDDNGAVERLRLVQKYWLDGQADYFVAAAERCRRLARRLNRVGQALVFAGFGIAVIDAFTTSIPYLIIPAIGLPVAAGLICLYANKRGLYEHANQYERMGKLYSDASRRLGQRIDAGDASGGRRLLFKIGQEALAENADWVILHRDRPLESPNIL